MAAGGVLEGGGPIKNGGNFFFYSVQGVEGAPYKKWGSTKNKPENQPGDALALL